VTVDWIHLVQDREPAAGSYENGKEHFGSIKEENFLMYE
jgi:hypothetical protein